MPIYEYQCLNCDNQFEALVFSSDETEPACSQCQSANVAKLMSAGCILNSGAAGTSSDIGASAASGCMPAGGG